MGTAKNAVGSIGKDEVTSSNLVSSSIFLPRNPADFGAFCFDDGEIPAFARVFSVLTIE